MTTWTPVHSTTFAGPVAPVAAGGVLTDGWVDISGNVWSVDSSNLARSTAQAAPWNTGLFLRPVSEDMQDAQVVATQTVNATQVAYFVFRSNRSTSSENCYLLGVNYTGGKYATSVFSVVGGVTKQLGGNLVLSPQPASGDVLTTTFSVVQTNSTTTTFTGSVANASGTVLASFTGTDTTAALQNVSGSTGVCEYSASTGGLVGISKIATYTDLVATTGYTLTGPTAIPVGAASTYTVTPNGSGSSAAITVTPTSTLSGSFSPTSVTFAANSAAAQTFAFTPSAAGSGTLSTTNSGGLTDPTALSVTATVRITVAVSSSAFLFSPGNWRGDGGRTGTSYMQSWNNGAWFKFTWTASANPTATLLLGASGTSSLVSYFLNGVPTLSVAANANITLSGLVSGATNTLWVFLKASTQSGRFAFGSSTNIVQVLGVQIDGNSTAGAAPAAKPWILWVGDSITEGINANAGTADFLSDYSYLCLAGFDQLGYDMGVSACGYSGWITVGDSGGDVPAYYSVSGSTNGAGGTYSASASRWNKIDSTQSLLDSNGHISGYGATGQEPAAIFINYMTNEAINAKSTSDAQASVTQCLVALRAAAPNAWIFVQVPFGIRATSKYPPAYLTALTAGVSAYQAAYPADAKVVLIDLGAAVSATIQSGLPYIGSDYVHPYAPGHALVAPLVTQAITAKLKQTAGRSYVFS